MILPIYVYGQPVLRKVADDITKDYPNLKEFISDMYETLEKTGGIGLAAPQVGKAIRVVIIDLHELAEDYPEYADFRKTYINSHIIEYGDEKDSSEEGCLSLPGISEKVVRPKQVHIRYMDEDFLEHDEWVDGYLARVIQHESDHLEGRVFTDIISPLRKQLIKKKLTQLLKGNITCRYKVKFKK
ncbi:MAG: peptide deformylase [Prevotella sp.]|nr:peptide deformylase [Candidatus Equicola faecalis]